MIIQKAYKIRLYPTKEQEQFLNRTFGCCRFLYNQMLHERKTVYAQLKEKKKELKQYKYKTEKQYKQIFPFLAEVDSIALQSSREHLQDAFQRFFTGLHKAYYVGYPRFKSRKAKQSFTTKRTNNNIKIDFDQKLLKIPRMKTWLKFRDSRRFSEKIRKVTISKTKSGHYYASIGVQEIRDLSMKTDLELEKIEAFDMSFSKVLVGSFREFLSPRFYRQEETRLKRLHRKHARTEKGSHNREKARVRLARKYAQITNRRVHWTHQLVNALVSEYDAVILEDLNIEGIKRFNKGSAKSVTLDFSWGEFARVLAYKMHWQGKYVQFVDRWFPSSKLCSVCGYKYNALQLHQRQWTCPQCQTHHDRDINASQNLLKEGVRLLQQEAHIMIKSTVGITGSHACGDDVRLSLRKQLSMNQESPSFKKG